MPGTVAITEICQVVLRRLCASVSEERGNGEGAGTQALSLRSYTLEVVIQSVGSADSEKHEDDCSKWNHVSRSRFAVNGIALMAEPYII
jgi:hypothetical protein